jgi:hypothetical protein
MTLEALVNAGALPRLTFQHQASSVISVQLDLMLTLVLQIKNQILYLISVY